MSTLCSLFLELRILPVMSQPPNPGLSLGKEQREASDYTDLGFSGGQQLKTEIHTNAFTPLDRIIQFQNKIFFEYHCSLTLN